MEISTFSRPELTIQKEKDSIQLRAKYDFVPEVGCGELGLNKGELLVLTSKHPGTSSPSKSISSSEESGWWSGINNRNESGIFPSAYVELLTSSSCNSPERDLSPEVTEGPPENVPIPAPLSVPMPTPLSAPMCTSTSIPSCYVCGCNDFVKNVFKKDSCNNCFHKHIN